MRPNLTEIKERAAGMRRSHGVVKPADLKPCVAQNRNRSSRAAPAGSFWPTLQAVRASTKCWHSVVSTS